VEQRRREIGIRIAVGATPHAVQRTVMAVGMRATAIGILGGLVVAAVAARAARGLLYGVSADDPATYVVVALLVVVAALCGAWRPVARASRADPATVLRSS
jgi:ABC-type antimicrobial peptide transport system permease subunit